MLSCDSSWPHRAQEEQMNTDAYQDLRDLVAERVAAVHAKNPNPLAARQAPDVIMFNVLPPLHMQGKDAVLKQTQAWFDLYASDIGYDIQDLHVDVDGDLGFCSFLYHVSGTLVAGGVVDMWVRATLCCRRVSGTWLITHDHESVPFDAATGKALLDLQP
jgi:uncharacterized protein (TIGR02246 family)